MLATLITGYADLAEWLMLFAFVVFGAAAVLAFTDRPIATDAAARARAFAPHGALVALGLALIALAWLVL